MEGGSESDMDMQTQERKEVWKKLYRFNFVNVTLV